MRIARNKKKKKNQCRSIFLNIANIAIENESQFSLKIVPAAVFFFVICEGWWKSTPKWAQQFSWLPVAVGS